MPDSAPTSPLLSPASIHGSLYGSLTAPPEVNNVAETLAAMKGSLGNLGQLFDALGHQATQMVQIGGELETAQHLNKVRKEMVAQDKKQEEQIEDIKALLEQALQYEIIEHLRTIIEQGVLDQIDELVKEQVSEQLPTYFPQEIEEELALYRQQLDEVQRAFHNSESRRSNSLLRSDKLSDPLHTIYKTDGTLRPSRAQLRDSDFESFGGDDDDEPEEISKTPFSDESAQSTAE
ncbi:hypothetical protein NLI96_g6373 [Meripilus lineatus]|uniref:Uncharacterized protein n=1 Tax=Meripilus lineatus TaxID=2056292 RepID=A0AAD5V1E1_9APHY|nr:hypothetical protein NLI96_g6373 [Physisporinus lineatus]